MTLKCAEPKCERNATIRVGKVLNVKKTNRDMEKEIYDDLWFCTEHAKQFLKNYGGENDNTNK